MVVKDSEVEYSQATKADVKKIVHVLQSCKEELADKLLLPWNQLATHISVLIEKQRLFIALDTISSSVVAIKTLYRVDPSDLDAVYHELGMDSKKMERGDERTAILYWGLDFTHSGWRQKGIHRQLAVAALKIVFGQCDNTIDTYKIMFGSTTADRVLAITSLFEDELQSHYNQILSSKKLFQVSCTFPKYDSNTLQIVRDSSLPATCVGCEFSCSL